VKQVTPYLHVGTPEEAAHTHLLYMTDPVRAAAAIEDHEPVVVDTVDTAYAVLRVWGLGPSDLPRWDPVDPDNPIPPPPGSTI
jgi:hypothetical protein